MPTTTNFGWTTPADTDLVKDGAAAIRTLAGNIDTSLVDLKGGTSGQYLTKNSNTDLDYTWVTLPTAGGMTLLSTTTLSGATVTIGSISGAHKSLVAYIFGVTNATGNGVFKCKANNSDIATQIQTSNSSISWDNRIDQSIEITSVIDNILRTSTDNVFTLVIDNYANATAFKSFHLYGGYLNSSSAKRHMAAFGYLTTTSAISSLVFSNTGGNLSTGTVLLYGVS